MDSKGMRAQPERVQVTPAYGRNYYSAEAALADWAAGADFKLAAATGASARWLGSYCSRRDFDGKHVAVMIRYGIELEHGVGAQEGFR